MNEKRPTCYKLSDYIDTVDYNKELNQANHLLEISMNNVDKLNFTCIIDANKLELNDKFLTCKKFYYVKNLLNNEIYYISALNIELIYNQVFNKNIKLNEKLNNELFIIFNLYIENDFDIIYTIINLKLFYNIVDEK